jgi:hypothetical protein
MSDIRIVNLSSHQSPIFTPTKNKEWMLNGKDNAGYNYIIDRYKYSPTNSAIIDSYSNYINGKGLTAKYTPAQASEWAKIQSIITKDELRKICQDFAIFEESSVEIILGKSGSEIVSITHLPKEKVMPSVVDENGEISSYFYSYDWSDIRKYPPEEIPAFTLDTKEKRTVYIIKKYSISDFYFTRPSYFSGLNYAELEEEIAVYSVNHIKNGLSAGHIINFNDGEADTEVKDRIERNIDKKLAGSNNAGKRILSFNSNKENATTVEAIEISDAHQQYQFFSEEARRQLMVAHKVTSPILFGIKDNTGFGNNADEMTTAFDELMLNVIKPKQDVILEGLMYLLKQNKSTLKLEFIPLRGSAVGTEIDANQNSYNGAQIASAIDVVAKVKEGILTKEQAIVFLIQFLQLPKEVALAMFTEQTVPIQQLSKFHKFNEVSVAEGLIALGEDENLNEWELVAECEVDYTNEYNFASTGLAFPNAKSEQDNTDYMVRYQYAPLKVSENSRDFCRKMVNAGKIYRKEDIIRMENEVVNAGWGAEGADKYSIWLYKGGGDCHHKWFRKIYVKKGVKVDVNSPLAELISTTKARQEGFNPPTNNDLVAIAPKDMPNNGFLKDR